MKAVMESWYGGINSAFHPATLSKLEYAFAENIINRAGIIQTRPGFTYKCAIPGTLCQGGTLFTNSKGKTCLVVAVDGKIYAAQHPFSVFERIVGLNFSAAAPIINFQVCYQSVIVTEAGALSIRNPPRLILIIQDNKTQAGYWDGSAVGHIAPESPFLGPPIGLWMSWTSSRLWVASGSTVRVSDIGNPLSFRENEYLAEKSNFELPGDVTGMIETPDRTGLLVFTQDTTTSFRSAIRKRSTWQETQDFQKLEIPNVGCVAGKSPINQFGLTYWFSKVGLIDLNSALYTRNNAELPCSDAEMDRSKYNVNPDKSGICTGDFGNFLLVSVPSGHRYNEHTWVLDQLPTQIRDGASKAWASIWTGIRPIEWMIGTVFNQERCFAICYDATVKDSSHIHLWEVFSEDKLDNGGPISCMLETGIVQGPGMSRFNHAELEICEILGEVDMQAFAGGIKGPWIEVLSTHLTAERGSFGSRNQPLITPTSVIEAYKPQNRTLRTQELAAGMLETCEQAETPQQVGIDNGWGMLFEWVGQMGIRRITINTTDIAEGRSGKCEETESGLLKAVNDRGETVLVEA